MQLSSLCTSFPLLGNSAHPPGEKAEPCSRDAAAHYSFDMAQQVFYPNYPLQPGPMYFLTPRKGAIFGVCCKAIPHQVNYLIDEAVDMGKGANTVVSMLHHFFEVQGLGEDVHVDNCPGLNVSLLGSTLLVCGTTSKREFCLEEAEDVTCPMPSVPEAWHTCHKHACHQHHCHRYPKRASFQESKALWHLQERGAQRPLISN